MRDETRNLNPTPEARVAMSLFAKRYADQGGGSMDFWDGLSSNEQRLCQRITADVLEAAFAHGRARPPLK